MKAIVQTEYGSPDVLSMAEVELPVVPHDGVLVKVHASSVHAGDWHLMRGKPFFIRFLFGGLRKPKIKILGCDVAGVVTAVGQDVTQLQPGDAVFGDLSEVGFGAFAEYVCVPETALGLKPANLSFVAAATVPSSALAALQGLRDVGQLQAGQHVWVNGAAGGVGSFAVQIAKAFGAQVTGVCSASKVEFVRSLGADQVCDYAQATTLLKTQQYDLILDAAAYRSVFDYFPALPSNGIYVLVGGASARFIQIMLCGGLLTKLSRRQIKYLATKPTQLDLQILKELLEAGKIRPFVDRCYPLSAVPTALHDLEQRRVSGKLAIQVE